MYARLEVLLVVAHDSDISVRANALEALAFGDLQDARIVETLMEALDDTHPGARSITIAGLRYRDAKQAIPRIRELLHSDEDSNVRGEAVWGLAGLAGREAIPDLTRALEDDGYAQQYEEKVSTLARQQLAKLQDDVSSSE
jgi:HEAT repeat protein